MKSKFGKISLAIILLLLIAILFLKRCHTNSKSSDEVKTSIQHSTPESKTGTEKLSHKKNNDIPDEAYEILHYIQRYHEAPTGYVGGRDFKNLEGRLDKKGSDGTKIRYHEWDIYPKSKTHNRGTKRLITGSDGRVWYTSDHYKTFTEIKE